MTLNTTDPEDCSYTDILLPACEVEQLEDELVTTVQDVMEQVLEADLSIPMKSERLGVTRGPAVAWFAVLARPGKV